MAPRGFATGSQQVQIVPASFAADHERSASLRRGELNRRYQETMKQAPATSERPPLRAMRAVKRGPSPFSDERSELAKARPDLRQALAAAAATPRPLPKVRTDYFGTAEHKALADCLLAILRGDNPFAREQRDDLSHVLFRLKDPTQPVDGAIDLDQATLVQNAGWQSVAAGDLNEVVSSRLLERDLTIRDTLTLRYGDIVALAGDYFADPDSLRDDLTAGEVADIRKVLPTATGTFSLTLNRPFEYLSLANKNTAHFTPWNWARYTRHHAEALLLALDRRFEEALVRNAFADHFLSDAFASGHLRTPRPLLNGLLQAKPMHDEDNEHGLWAHNLEGYLWHCYGDDTLGVNPVHLAMTAVSLARSIQRVCRAYRLSGPDADRIKALAQDAIAKTPVMPDHPEPDPNRTHALLGDVGLGWPSIRTWIPVAVAAQAIPGGTGMICNYPPKFAWDGTKRKGSDPDFAAYFRFK